MNDAMREEVRKEILISLSPVLALISLLIKDLIDKDALHGDEFEQYAGKLEDLSGFLKDMPPELTEAFLRLAQMLRPTDAKPQAAKPDRLS